MTFMTAPQNESPLVFLLLSGSRYLQIFSSGCMCNYPLVDSCINIQYICIRRVHHKKSFTCTYSRYKWYQLERILYSNHIKWWLNNSVKIIPRYVTFWTLLEYPIRSGKWCSLKVFNVISCPLHIWSKDLVR